MNNQSPLIIFYTLKLKVLRIISVKNVFVIGMEH